MFLPPVFNLVIAIWDPPHSPRFVPPDRTAFGQMYVTSKIGLDVRRNQDNIWQPPIFVRCPKGTDMSADGYVVIPGGFAPAYKIRFVEVIHLGQSNEYVSAIVEQRFG
jgi:hypothetical protein